ncbi:hypothetical protein [Seonamhaeicola sp.]|uniref:hypothetical protein n=1 Tax=Seonamhaeicola sp. TaxID=1912245 RepID=UPI002602EA60|nr:hypothetical protein [Seonamhaeicola sp.]
MKNSFIKIASIFFLTVLLASNVVNLHIYFHEQVEALNNCQNNDSENHDNEEDSDIPCDLCHIAFTLNGLDYNKAPEFSIKSTVFTQQYTLKDLTVHVELLHEQPCLNNNRNKAPPSLV